MKNIDSEILILSKIFSEKFAHIYETMRVLEREINALEAIPIGSKNEPHRFSGGHIDAKKSIERRKQFLESPQSK